MGFKFRVSGADGGGPSVRPLRGVLALVAPFSEFGFRNSFPPPFVPTCLGYSTISLSPPNKVPPPPHTPDKHSAAPRDECTCALKHPTRCKAASPPAIHPQSAAPHTLRAATPEE